MSISWVRAFSTSRSLGRAGYSSVEPVHHLVKINKAALSPRYEEVLMPKDDIRSLGFKPTEFEQDRVKEHFNHTLESDLMLALYEHDAQTIVGEKRRRWEPDSPYALYRHLRKARHVNRPTRDVHPIGPDNVPRLTGISINLYAKEAVVDPVHNIAARLQIAQITNVKPQQTKLKVNYQPWKLRKGKRCGAKVELLGQDMSQFLTTLTELVLPRIRTFKGISETSGDNNGNISFGLDTDDVKFFPEIENFQDLYPKLFGFHITFKTTARTDEAAKALLSSLGLPFYKK
ncbi:hypothetical protein FT663_01378 [Candidozyma haemuli var. vulneris]|uniref:Large ribosomal subunit protein uL5m n=1 Tax=Candidozyma haemuli TaxID=45357 RepID=A0A2V1AZ19_9ASCO|nr:hypothetical protein CXQ85_002780 [[Candida] haemuloni]KAF3992513.1 hypothetical protein FT662_01059 [[Candida] haemuloni var. vulneris]KAF3994465.1 hypothetical protein FT663_01378 [[Candida] haemuloni var. vulneris]PVH23054.1 hypothetical protein CXQ85_002780 [[Candida] haemuloni]